MRQHFTWLAMALLFALPACESATRSDGGPALDGSTMDAAAVDDTDGGEEDAAVDDMDGGEEDAAVDDMDGGDGPPEPCATQFGDVDGFGSCAEEPTGCTFNATLGGTLSCDDVCAAHGATCLRQYDNGGPDLCLEGGEKACDSVGAGSDLCECTRGPAAGDDGGTDAGPDGGAPIGCDGALLFEWGFETGALPGPVEPDGRPVVASGNVPDVVEGDAREGSWMMRSRLTPSSSVKYRTEIHLNRIADILPDTEYWVGFSTRLGADFEDVTGFNDQGMVFQTHYRSNLYDDPPPDAQPFVVRHLSSSDFQVHSELVSSPYYVAPRGALVWNDWVIHIRMSDGPAGYVQVWRDGVLVVDETGRNHESFFVDGVYMKMGYYASQLRSATMPPGSSRTVYHDAIRFAGSDGCYALVAPR